MKVMLDVESAPVITPAMERAIVRAFEEFNEEYVPASKRVELEARREPGLSCDHVRLPVPQTDENLRFLRELFGEKDIGKEQTYCAECGAVFLYGGCPDRFGNDNSVGSEASWGYDATARFYGKVPKQERRDDKRKPKR